MVAGMTKTIELSIDELEFPLMEALSVLQDLELREERRLKAEKAIKDLVKRLDQHKPPYGSVNSKHGRALSLGLKSPSDSLPVI